MNTGFITNAKKFTDISNTDHIYIYHHLGLGDHVSCHGIVRYYCEKYKKVSLFAKPKYFHHIEYMYNDIENLNIIPADDPEVEQYIKKHNLTNVLYVGFTLNTKENFIKQFYNMANVPIEYEHTKFYINRNIEKEKILFNSLNITEDKYIFAHDNSLKNSKYLINKNLPIISPDVGDFFDWIYTIENAKEIHCIDSSFICLADLIDTKNIPLFNHRYVKRYPPYISLNYKKNKPWIILT